MGLVSSMPIPRASVAVAKPPCLNAAASHCGKASLLASAGVAPAVAQHDRCLDRSDDVEAKRRRRMGERAWPRQCVPAELLA